MNRSPAPSLAWLHGIRRWVLWLLVAVVPVQANAVGIFTVLGPAHSHQPAQVKRELVDFRRWSPKPRPDNHVMASVGHFHSSSTPERHYHDPSDATVVFSGDDVASTLFDADGGLNAGASLASVIGVLSAVGVWSTPPMGTAKPWRPAWSPHTDIPDPLERPPKQA
jgi:hypothetical protein